MKRRLFVATTFGLGLAAGDVRAQLSPDVSDLSGAWSTHVPEESIAAGRSVRTAASRTRFTFARARACSGTRARGPNGARAQATRLINTLVPKAGC